MRIITPRSFRCIRTLYFLVVMGLGDLVQGELLPLPVEPGQRSGVTCLETPSVRYDLYLPSSYSRQGTPLPILYTLNPNGGGMVNHFREAGEKLGVILIGLRNTSNDASLSAMLRDFFAVSRDVRQRILFDPTAELVGGFSGGGEYSYVFSRFRSQHVAGVISIGGWLGRTGIAGYETTDRVLDGLLVGRITGQQDPGGQAFLVPDQNFLLPFGAIIRDWEISGGHSINIPQESQEAAIRWILTNRNAGSPSDREEAQSLASRWRSDIEHGEREKTFREVTATLLDRPRSWFAHEAQLIMDDLMADFETFRQLNVEDLATGDIAANLFFYYGRGASDARDKQRYYSAFKALTGITGDNGERAGDIWSVIRRQSYPSSDVRVATDPEQGTLTLTISKETRGLALDLQVSGEILNPSWTTKPLEIEETDSYWTIKDVFLSEPGEGFYRIESTPVRGFSPPWPP